MLSQSNQRNTFGRQAGPPGARYTQWGGSANADAIFRLMAAQQVSDANARYANLMRSWFTAEQIINQDIRYMGAVAVRRTAQDVLQQVAINYVGQYAQLIATFNDVLNSQIDRESEARMMTIYSEIAVRATAEVVKSYKQGLRKNALRYRGSDPGRYQRFSGGRLERALQTSLFRVTPKGLEYIIAPSLDRAAPQWYRMNFGAGARGGVKPKTYNIKLFDATVAGPDLTRYTPSKAFMIPAGYWSSQAFASTSEFMANRGGRGGAAFYPLIPGQSDSVGQGAFGAALSNPNIGADGMYARGRRAGSAAASGGGYAGALGGPRPQLGEGRGMPMSARRVSRGIYGTGFLDEGMRVFNLMLGPSLEYMFTEWAVKAAGDAVKPLGRTNPTGMMSPLTVYGTAQNVAWVEQLRVRLGDDEKYIMKAKNDINVAVQRLQDTVNGNLLRTKAMWQVQPRVAPAYAGPSAPNGAARLLAELTRQNLESGQFRF